jgi:excisionase family DNA binding protein
MSSFASGLARLLANAGIWNLSALRAREFRPTFSTKGPQSFAVLNFRPHLVETWSSPRVLPGHQVTRARRRAMTISPLHPPSDRQLVFTSSQAARYVGVSLATIRRWTDAGHIHCYRTPGGQRRFSRDQLDDFVTSMQNAGKIHVPPATKVA